MDSILVFDDFKHCFRELDTSNYNDDLVVGSVFFTRDAINCNRRTPPDGFAEQNGRDAERAD